jgi:hypothetical protein
MMDETMDKSPRIWDTNKFTNLRRALTRCDGSVSKNVIGEKPNSPGQSTDTKAGWKVIKKKKNTEQRRYLRIAFLQLS